MMQVKDYPQMKIRLSPELKALIDESAQANNRTLNAEITARLEASFHGCSIGCAFNDERFKELIREELARLTKAGIKLAD
jgi:hypothetical protein